MQIDEFINTLDEHVVDDILNNNCQVIVGYGIENENYVYDMLAQYFQVYDTTTLSQLFDVLEENVHLQNEQNI